MPAEKLAESVLSLVSFMHVWYVDKEMEQNSRNCPPYGLYGSANFAAFRAESVTLSSIIRQGLYCIGPVYMYVRCHCI